jgi:hypothetical protein
MAHCPRLSSGREAPRRAALIRKPARRECAEVGRLEAEAPDVGLHDIDTASALMGSASPLPDFRIWASCADVSAVPIYLCKGGERPRGLPFAALAGCLKSE